MALGHRREGPDFQCSREKALPCILGHPAFRRSLLQGLHLPCADIAIYVAEDGRTPA
jgi:hypothetical protein